MVYRYNMLKEMHLLTVMKLFFAFASENLSFYFTSTAPVFSIKMNWYIEFCPLKGTERHAYPSR
jgi:hypothetical protein